jgi:hypothetical protein
MEMKNKIQSKTNIKKQQKNKKEQEKRNPIKNEHQKTNIKKRTSKSKQKRLSPEGPHEASLWGDPRCQPPLF